MTLAADIAAFKLPTVATTTSTGTQNDFAPGVVGVGETVVRCNNASDLTITGLAAGTDGQRVRFLSLGAGNVFFKHQNAGSVAANRFLNFATSGDTPLAAGVGTALYIYDGITGRWRLTDHEQGSFISPAFNAGDFTASASMTWTVIAANVAYLKYCLRGRQLTVVGRIQNSSVGGTPDLSLKLAIPGGYVSGATIRIPMSVKDNGTIQTGLVIINSSAPFDFRSTAAGGVNWTASTNNTQVDFCFSGFEVT